MRCPTCHYLTDTPGPCAVCQSGAPVRRIEGQRDTAWTIQQIVSMPFSVKAPRAAPAPGAGRPAKPGAPRQTAACETPGCSGTITRSVAGLKQMQKKGRPVRCRACLEVQRTAWQNTYNAKRRRNA